MIIIGSQAIKDNYPDYKIRKSADWDVILKDDIDFKTFKVCPEDWKKEILVQKEDNEKYELLKYYDKSSNQWIETLESSPHVYYATPLSLLTIKMSHLHHKIRDNAWKKHAYDTWFLQSKILAFDPDFDFMEIFQSDLYKARRAEADDRFKDPRRPNWNLSNKEFFEESSSVDREYSHDDLHNLIKYYDEPLYNRIKNDVDYAKCAEDKFYQLEYKDQLRVVWEEAYTLCLERYIIPHNQNIREAYTNTMMLMVTRLTSGWFRDFIIANYHTLFRPEIDFKKKFESVTDLSLSK